MMDLKNLEMRVAQLEARTALSELVTQYGIACDEHDISGLKYLFTKDAEITSTNGLLRAKGRDEITEMFCKVLATRGPGYHWTHDHIIRFDRGSEHKASGLLLSHAETTPNGVQSLAGLKYDDEYRFEEGTWRFAKRSLSFLYYVPASEYKTVLTQENRVVAGDKRLFADYPENLTTWQNFDSTYVGK